MANFTVRKRETVMPDFTIAIHGGAGTILKEDMTPDLEKAYFEGLQQALDISYAVLEEGGTAVNAVKAALVLLEDNVFFNAGRGSVYQERGTGNGCGYHGWV